MNHWYNNKNEIYHLENRTSKISAEPPTKQIPLPDIQQENMNPVNNNYNETTNSYDNSNSINYNSFRTDYDNSSNFYGLNMPPPPESISAAFQSQQLQQQQQQQQQQLQQYYLQQQQKQQQLQLQQHPEGQKIQSQPSTNKMAPESEDMWNPSSMELIDKTNSNNNNGLNSNTGRSSTPISTSSDQSSNPQSSTRKKDNNRVKVIVRVRPPIPEDVNPVIGDFEDCTSVDEDRRNIRLARNYYEDREFKFDYVLGQDCSQEKMYGTIAHDIVEDVLEGYNGTVFAYGQTGTGKTYTIFGPACGWDRQVGKQKRDQVEMMANLDSDGGVIFKAVKQIFDHIEQTKDTEFRVAVSFLQIYMESIMDLFDPSKQNLNIREDPRYGIYVDDLTQVPVSSVEDVINLIQESSRNRAMGGTSMNKISTRSHVLVSLTVEQRPFKNDAEKNVKRGTLTIVDLAGSERVSKSGSEGKRLEEAKTINKSLSALGNCVASLTDPGITHVPFRDSKLTRLLTDSLGGNSKTCLCATIGPSSNNYDESYSTLLFATRAMSVENHAVINEVVDFKTLSGNLQRKISMMEDEKMKLMSKNVELERELTTMRYEMEHMRYNGTRNQENGDEGDLNEPGNDMKWAEREKELVGKFSAVIRHLQNEIAGLNKRIQAFENENQTISGTQIPEIPEHPDSVVLDQLANTFLAMPAFKKKLISKLGGEQEILTEYRNYMEQGNNRNKRERSGSTRSSASNISDSSASTQGLQNEAPSPTSSSSSSASQQKDKPLNRSGPPVFGTNHQGVDQNHSGTVRALEKLAQENSEVRAMMQQLNMEGYDVDEIAKLMGQRRLQLQQQQGF